MRGQAVIEYVFLLLLMILFLSEIFSGSIKGFRGSSQVLSHELHLKLWTGICPENCFFTGYQNEYKGN